MSCILRAGDAGPATVAESTGWLLANVRILSTLAPVHEDADRQSPLVTSLVAGDEARLVEATTKNGQRWVAAKLPGGREGFVPGDTRVYVYSRVRLLDEEVTAYEHPSPASLPKGQYRKRAQFRIIDTIESGPGAWVKVRDYSGAEGFIPGATRVQKLQDGAG